MNYILSYYQAIKTGGVVVGKWIQLWYEKIVRGIEDGVYIFDPKKANKAIKFIESFCRHHEGKLGGQLIRLELWQKAFISTVFGIVDENGYRVFREVLLVVGRKNGKTLLSAALAAYCTYADGEIGGRVLFVAPKLAQAQLCYNAYYQMIQQEPELKALTNKRRSDIYIKESNTSAMPLPFSAKKTDGLNPSYICLDELASWQGDAGLKQYEVLRSALGARSQPLTVSITTAGYCQDGIYTELMKRSTAVITGASAETRLAPFLYMIDDPSKWDDINEVTKANPNIGVSVSAEYLIEEAAIASSSLSKKGEYLTKYCNIVQGSVTAWLEYEQVERCCGKHFDVSDFHGYCVAGIDLSQVADLTAAGVLYEKNGELYWIVHFWMPAASVERNTARDGLPYDIYRQRGELSISGDNYVDYRDVYNWFRSIVKDCKLYPLYVGYDRYSAQYLVEDLNAAGFHTDSVYQGSNLTPYIRELYGLIADGRLHIGDNQLMKACLLNSALKHEEEAQKVKLVKVGTYTRIDGTAALLDALVMRQNKYKEIGGRLLNKGV